MKISIRDMTLIPLFTVLAIIGGKFTIPTLLIPVTLQFAVCLLTGILLGARRAFMAQLLYLLIGLSGLPVFATGGGLSYVLQPSFGYLLGMMFCATFIGWLSDRMDPSRMKIKIWQIMTLNLAGQLIVYILGVSYLYLIKNFYAGQDQTFIWAIKVGMIPFLLSDGAFSILTAIIGPRLRRATRPFLQNKATPAPLRPIS